MVIEVDNFDEFKKHLKNAGNKLVVVDFTADWCGPCKKMGPIFHECSTNPEFADVIFLKVDVDVADDVSRECKITCMPTFQFYKNEKMVDEFSGSNDAKLLEYLKRLR